MNESYKELIGLFLKVEVLEFKEFTADKEEMDTNEEGHIYWYKLYTQILDKINKTEDIGFLKILSCGNAGGVERELKLSIFKGKFNKTLIVLPHTSGKIEHLQIREEMIK